MSVAAGFRRGVHSAVFTGVRRVVHQKVEQMVGADIAQSRSEEYGEDLIVADGLVQRRDQMLLRDRSRVEELFHQLIFALGNDLDEFLVRLLALLRDVVWDRAFFA